MRAVLESFEDDEITINFLRQILISLYGYLRADDVYETAARRAKGESQAIAFLAQLETGSVDYAAILNPEHEKWNTYSPWIRRAIATLSSVRMRAMRPLLLSVARRFTPAEADRAMRLILRLSVRLRSWQRSTPSFRRIHSFRRLLRLDLPRFGGHGVIGPARTVLHPFA
jgi:hypothetical protein